MYLIRPRKYQPTHYGQFQFGFLPWWVRIPYHVIRLSYLVVMKVAESDAPGYLKLMAPLALFHFCKETYEIFILGEFMWMQLVAYILMWISVLLFLLFKWSKKHEEKQKGITSWNKTTWLEYDSQYSKLRTTWELQHEQHQEAIHERYRQRELDR